MIAALIFAMAVVIIIPATLMRGHQLSLRHQERMTALEKGVAIPPETGTGYRTYLRNGLLWLFTGIGVFLSFGAIAATTGSLEPRDHHLQLVEQLREKGWSDAQIDTYAGTAPKLPIGLPFLGFIPIGVGMAYLIFYRSEKKRPGALP